MLDKEYEFTDIEDDRTISPMLVCVDSGHRQSEVYAFCRQNPKLCRPTKGVQTLSGGARYKSSPIDKDYEDRPIPGSIKLYSFNTTYYKNKVADAIEQKPDTPKSFHVFAGIDDTYCNHLTAEEKRREMRGGILVDVWGLRRGRHRNDMLDYEVLCELGADMIGVGWRADQRSRRIHRVGQRRPVSTTDRHRPNWMDVGGGGPDSSWGRS